LALCTLIVNDPELFYFKMIVNGSQVGKHPCAIDWHHKFWPWITLNHPISTGNSEIFTVNISNMVTDTIWT